MGLFSLIRRSAPLLALGAAGVVLARRRAEARGQLETPYAPPPPVPQPEVSSPPAPSPPVQGAPPPAATDGEVVRSVYDAPPVEDPIEGDIEDPLEEEAPVGRPEGETGPDSSPSPTVTDVVDDLLAPLPSEDEIEDATVVDDDPGAGDRPPGDYAR